METKVNSSQQFPEGHRHSALGFRLRELRKQIESAADRGETQLFAKDELDPEIQAMRNRDPDVS